MPYKYIGRTHDFKGKSLWEILGNLRNMGVGRIVTRSKFERYPEPSYMKILKVEPLPQPVNQPPDYLRNVRVLVQKTFRGKTIKDPILIESTSYKTDYRLIPKHEETTYCKLTQPSEPTAQKILPRTMEFPPLLRELIKRECISTKGQVENKDLQLEISYNKRSLNSKYVIAKEGQEATEKFVMGLGKPVAFRLYEGIVLKDEV
ncbi:small ribosomal subunit protein mS34 [Euwallacea fornicatus]|uniref:small ribosomal subunit protein mS34 n=1 Tax=Euwallacea fornicatus TaxID=995702 RepID=UPI00338F33B4